EGFFELTQLDETSLGMGGMSKRLTRPAPFTPRDCLTTKGAPRMRLFYSWILLGD
ncbi:uncharacterized protein METZ01_LOCUS122026, partial [marine metagenome]